MRFLLFLTAMRGVVPHLTASGAAASMPLPEQDLCGIGTDGMPVFIASQQFPKYTDRLDAKEEHMENVLQAAQLRAKGKHDEALALVDATLPTLPDQERFLLMLQGLYAAEEAANAEKAHAYARELAELEPNLVSIQPYVALAPEDIASLDFKR
jgi:hypothetical protein